MEHVLVLIAGISGFLAVALGAFGAHALRKRLSPENLAVFQTGVQYQMIHTLAILAVALLQFWASSNLLMMLAGWLFVIGIILFSGSLYLLAVTKNRAFGPITPLGGLAFLAGWVCLILASFSVA